MACLDGSNLVETLTGHRAAAEIKEGDMVKTLRDAAVPTYTKVTRNVLNRGVVAFTEVGLDDGKSFNVTSGHIVAVKRATGDVEIEQARNLKVGDVMMTSSTEVRVVATRTLQQSSRWSLETEIGSVLVNDVLVTSICEDTFSRLPNTFSSALEFWRQQHKAVSDAEVLFHHTLAPAFSKMQCAMNGTECTRMDA